MPLVAAQEGGGEAPRLRRRRFCSTAVGLGAGWSLVPTVQAAAGKRAAAAPVLILRHAQTEPGTGDPPGFELGRCATQRNLSEQGRQQARRFGERLHAQGLRPTAIRSSRWCRCLDTARAIAAGLGADAPPPESWPALDSFFDDRAREPAQTAALRDRLAALRHHTGFELWVSHQVNISALTGKAPSMGDALWLTLAGDRISASPFG
jgi:phosphohistidine phosphatase SixA